MNEQELLCLNKENVYCAQSPKGYGLTHFAKKDFKCNATVMSGWGKMIGHQTSRFSIQIDLNKHFIPQKWAGKYWNHSCEPNTFVKTRPDGFPDLVARRNIQAHEEITYAYYMTEYKWSDEAEEKFISCRCGAEHCTGSIRSFLQLTHQEQLDLEQDKQLSHYLIELVKGTQNFRKSKNHFLYFSHTEGVSLQIERMNTQAKTMIKESRLITLNNIIKV